MKEAREGYLRTMDPGGEITGRDVDAGASKLAELGLRTREALLLGPRMGDSVCWQCWMIMAARRSSVAALMYM